MFAELLTWLITPAAWQARRLGYLSEAVAIMARYRRCRAAWQPHLRACQENVLAFSYSLAQRRTLVVLGSGPGYDLPLEELAKAWQSIVLVDLVHPWTMRRRVARLANVRLATWDIAGVIAPLVVQPNRLPQPHPCWALPTDCDALISLNVMAQLPIVPMAYLMRHGWSQAMLTPWCQSVVAVHWQQLVAAGCPVLLITDVYACWRFSSPRRSAFRMRERGADASAATTVEEHTLFGFRLPETPFCQWQWQIAPPGEIASEIEKVLTVVAVRVS